MRYVSTRGAWADAPAAVLGDPARRPRARRRPRGAGALSALLRRPSSTRCGRSAIADLAFAVLSRFIDDIPPADLRGDRRRAPTRARAFGSDAITPLSTLEPGLHLLHVSNGPTLAFKDIALQLLGNLFEYALARERRTLNILGATSGDTGSSAEYAMRGKRGIDVFMLSPQGPDEPVPAGADVLARRRRTSTTSRSKARSTTARTS